MSTMFIRWPDVTSGRIVEYANFAAFPVAGNNGDLALALDTDILYVYNSGSASWVVIGGPGVATSLGAFDGHAPDAKGLALDTNVLYAQSATAAFPGMVNISTQTFAGNKTFTGTISASNLSGTNTGDVTLSAFGSTANANGASLSGQALTLQPASASFPGGVSTTTQSFAGNKTFLIQLMGSDTTTHQAVFHGWDSNGAATHSGSIAIGDLASEQGIIHYDTTSSANLIFDNSFDNAAVGFSFRTRTSGTPLTALTLLGVGNAVFGGSVTATTSLNTTNGTVNATNTSAQQAIFKGWDTNGANAHSGSIAIGDLASEQGIIHLDATSSANLFIDNSFDNAAVGIVFRTRTSGTPATALTLFGTSAVFGGTVQGRYVRTATAISYTALTTDTIVGVTSTAAPRTITLPSATTAGAGFNIMVKDESGAAGTNNITIARAGADTIDGATSVVITVNYGSFKAYSDGAGKWFTL